MSSKIDGILSYSPQTVYNYRSILKNNAQCQHWLHLLTVRACGAYLRKFSHEPTLKSKACLKCLYFTKIISALCRNLEYFSYLYTIN